MPLVLPPLAAVALSGLHDIKGTIPPPDLPPFAVSALVAFAAVGAGAWSAARKRRGPQDPEDTDRGTPVDRLLKLRDAYCGGLPQPLLFDQLWEELRSLGLTGDVGLSPEQALRAAEDVVPAPLPLLRSLVETCDADRYGKKTLERDHVLATLDAAVAVVTTWVGRSL